MRALATDRLVLEPQLAAHAREMFAVLGDPALYAYENEPPPSVEWLRTRFAKLESRRSGDGSEQWLNWVIRIPSFEAIGQVAPGEALMVLAEASRIAAKAGA